jgi:hypothetical protein
MKMSKIYILSEQNKFNKKKIIITIKKEGNYRAEQRKLNIEIASMLLFQYLPNIK